MQVLKIAVFATKVVALNTVVVVVLHVSTPQPRQPFEPIVPVESVQPADGARQMGAEQHDGQQSPVEGDAAFKPYRHFSNGQITDLEQTIVLHVELVLQ